MCCMFRQYFDVMPKLETHISRNICWFVQFSNIATNSLEKTKVFRSMQCWVDQLISIPPDPKICVPVCGAVGINLAIPGIVSFKMIRISASK